MDGMSTVKERSHLKGIYSLKHEIKVAKIPHKKEAVTIQGASVLSSRFSVDLKGDKS